MREALGTVVSVELVLLPGLAAVRRALDQHGGRSERLEHDHQMSEVKLGLQIELDGNVLHAVLRLPPESFRVLVQIRDDIFDAFV